MRAAVIGASGHTGSFVARELLRRGHVPVGVYRDAAKAGAVSGTFETRVASIDDPASLDAALARTDLVINCAGPFLDTAAAVIDAALRAEIHYLDVTAEQESVRATFRSFDAVARERHVAIVPAAGFFGAAGDLAATAAMGDWPRANRIDVATALDRWHPTAGTRNTGDRNTFARVVIRQGKLAVHDAGEEARRTWPFAEPFGEQPVAEVPLSETILIAHHLDVAEMHNYLNEGPLGDLSDPATPPPVAADERGRSAQVFVIEAIAAAGGKRRFARVRGRDIYASTAPLVVEAAERLCGGESPDGVHAAGEIFDAAAFFHALEKRGELTFERGDA